MIKHHRTAVEWTNNKETWIWVTGEWQELTDLKDRAGKQFGRRMNSGLPDRIHHDYMMAFAFYDKQDAMMFKLSL